jgi:glycosyltransferase involved in cell wall biosynthesis
VLKPKKILIFSTAYYPFVGGAEIAIKEITDRISDCSFDLITAKLKPGLPNFERVGNINVYRLGFGVAILDKLLLPFLGVVKVKRLNNKNQYNFYWAMMVTFASGAGFIANLISNKKVPIILTLQEGDSEEYLKTKWFGILNLAWRLALKKSSVVTVISNYLGERAKKLGFQGEPILIPNGVDIKKFELKNTDNELREQIRKELGLKKDDVALITASRLNIKNGIGDVIKALPKLPENVKFVILGVGELEKELKELTKKLGVSERVIFKGFVSHNEMPKFLKACDIFIRASLSEGFGNSFVEAMAVKIPVIATPVGGVVDFLKENETGYFCQPESPKSVVEAVQRVVSDPNKGKIIESAYQMVQNKYNWDKIAKSMEILFNS